MTSLAYAEASISVVVPAHNGEATIDRSLRGLVDQEYAGAVSVAVVCNGCTDDTSERATRWTPAFAARGWSFAVLNSAPGRVAAITAGERHLGRGCPLVVVDQDAALTPTALREISEHLAGSAHFCAPRVTFAPASRLVEIYYAAWKRLPYVTAAPVTVGVYAISVVGRSRFEQFPDGAPDDKFARLQFEPHERAVTSTAAYEVLLPNDLAALVRARRGYDDSNRRLRNGWPGLDTAALRERHAGMFRWLLDPRNWPGALVMAFVFLQARHGRGKG